MGVFDRLVLFSEVHGTVLRTVLRDGQPVAGAEPVQKVAWSDDPDEIPPQRTTTDATGAFRFPSIERGTGLRRMIPAQPMMQQTITIHVEGQEYLAWRYGKDSNDNRPELGGRPLILVCELTRAPEHEGKHYGTARPCDTHAAWAMSSGMTSGWQRNSHQRRRPKSPAAPT